MKKYAINKTVVAQKCLIGLKKYENTILEKNHQELHFAIYLDLECLLKKEQSCQNNSEKSYTEEKAKHEPSAWAMYTKCSFDEKENKLVTEEKIVLKNCVKS